MSGFNVSQAISILIWKFLLGVGTDDLKQQLASPVTSGYEYVLKFRIFFAPLIDRSSLNSKQIGNLFRTYERWKQVKFADDMAESRRITGWPANGSGMSFNH